MSAEKHLLALLKLDSGLNARVDSLHFLRNISPIDEKELIGRELFELNASIQQIKPFLDGLWPEKPTSAVPFNQLDHATRQVVEMLLRVLSTELRDTAVTLRTMLQTSQDALTPTEIKKAVSSLHRLSKQIDLDVKAYFTAKKKGLELTALKTSLDETPDNELRLGILKRFDSLLEARHPFDHESLSLLRVFATVLPGRFMMESAQMDHLALACKGDGTYILPHASAWREAGVEEYDAMLWESVGIYPESAKEWRDSGTENAVTAYEWSGAGFTVAEAARWGMEGLLPSEAALYRAFGVRYPEKAVEIRNSLASVDIFLKWHRDGFTADEIIQWRRAGVKTSDQASALKSKGEIPLAQPVMVAGNVPPTAAAPPSAPAKSLDLDSWRSAMFTDEAAREWSALGLSPVQADAWQQAGPKDAATVRKWKQAGVEAPDEAAWLNRHFERVHGRSSEEVQEKILGAAQQDAAVLFWGVVFEAASLGQEMKTGWPGIIRAKTNASFKKLECVLGTCGNAGKPLFYAAIAASEHLAFSDKAASFSAPSAGAEWMEYLEKFCQTLGLPCETPGWYLTCFSKDTGEEALSAVLGWGAAYGQKVPWQDSPDYNAHEGEAERYARRASDFGGGDKPAAFLRQGPCILRQGATIIGSLREPARPKRFQTEAQWSAEFEDYCMTMDVPLKQAHWVLALVALA